ncbi:MAG: phage holin family protein [Deltaproteobacteria bacterium]|nr:phage holin family protein [Deltaproteobacteria bacterium]
MNNKVVNKDPTTQRDSFSELLGQLANTSADVVRDEIELVIQKSEKATAVRGGILTVAIGTVISFAAFMSLCAALIIGLTHYMARSWRRLSPERRMLQSVWSNRIKKSIKKESKP